MRTVIGYHACSLEYAKALCSGEIPISDWRFSRNKYDWLGHGIYFWEDGLRRAKEWARDFVDPPAAIVQAEIELGICLDLGDTEYLDVIRSVYWEVRRRYLLNGWKLPRNREIGRQKYAVRWLDRVNRWLYRNLAGVEFARHGERKLRYLDALIINEFIQRTQQELRFQTVRYPFEEGEPIFPGAMIRTQSHVQIAVLDFACIKQLSLLHI